MKILFYKKQTYSKKYLNERFDKLLQEFYDYHHRYGKYGLLSEKSDERQIYNKAKMCLENETRDEGGPKLTEVVVNEENLLETINKIENGPNFINWFMPTEEQIEILNKE